MLALIVEHTSQGSQPPSALPARTGARMPVLAGSTHLHHPDQGLRVLLKHALKGHGGEPEHGGRGGGASRHRLVGCGVALQ